MELPCFQSAGTFLTSLVSMQRSIRSTVEMSIYSRHMSFIHLVKLSTVVWKSSQVNFIMLKTRLMMLSLDNGTEDRKGAGDCEFPVFDVSLCFTHQDRRTSCSPLLSLEYLRALRPLWSHDLLNRYRNRRHPRSNGGQNQRSNSPPCSPSLLLLWRRTPLVYFFQNLRFSLPRALRAALGSVIQAWYKNWRGRRQYKYDMKFRKEKRLQAKARIEEKDSSSCHEKKQRRTLKRGQNWAPFTVYSP